MLAISSTMVLKARPSWPSSSPPTWLTRVENEPRETVLAALSNCASGWTSCWRSIQLVTRLTMMISVSRPNCVARSQRTFCSRSSSISTTTRSICSTKVGMSWAMIVSASTLPSAASRASGRMCSTQRRLTTLIASFDGELPTVLSWMKRSSPCSRRSNCSRVCCAWARFSGCSTSLRLRKLIMRSEPETLMALAWPLMFSAMTVEVTMDAKESRARMPMASPSRTSTESCKASEMEEKKRFMAGIADYLFFAWGYSDCPGSFVCPDSCA